MSNDQIKKFIDALYGIKRSISKADGLTDKFTPEDERLSWHLSLANLEDDIDNMIENAENEL